MAPLLEQKFRLGLFDDPYVDPGNAERIVGCDARREFAMEAALKTITLLKNDGGSWQQDDVTASDPAEDRRMIAEAVEVARSRISKASNASPWTPARHARSRLKSRLITWPSGT